MEQGTNLARVGAFNRSVVLDAVRRSADGVSRAAVSDQTGLTPQTVSNIAARLIDERLVREGGTTAGARGAPGRLLVLEPRERFAVGAHLDPAHLSVVLLDLAGDLVVERHVTDTDLTDPAAALPVLAESVLTVVADAGVDPERVLGAGLATPGPIDRDGVRLGDPSQLGRWRGTAVAAVLARRTGLPVRLEKDAVAGALGERWINPSTSPDDLVYLYLGHGVSAGFVVDGEVVRGATGNAGEFGGFPVHAHGAWTELWRACQPLQQVRRATGDGIAIPWDGSEDPRSVRAAFAALCRMPAAASLVHEAGLALGAAIAHLVELLDVSRVVVAGSSAAAGGPGMLTALRSGLEARITSPTPPPVVATTMGESAVARGAACAVLRAAFAPTATGLALPPRRTERVLRPAVPESVSASEGAPEERSAPQTWAPSRVPTA